MNKRQAKKNFKKKYGITPKEAEKLINVDVYETIKNITPKICEAINTFSKQFAEMAKAASEAIAEGMSQWSKAIAEYANFARTEEMLKNSIPLHPDLDDDLINRLEIREICKDFAGNLWKFYWDPANEVMYAKEWRGKSDVDHID